jgi:hypothetical protein
MRDLLCRVLAPWPTGHGWSVYASCGRPIATTQRASSSPSEIPTPPNLSRRPHTPAILRDLDLDLDLDRGGDAEWLAQHLALRRTIDAGLDDRPKLDRRAAEAIVAWNSRGRR